MHMPAGRYSSRNVVLRDHVSAAEIRAAAERNGWVFSGEIERDPEHGIFYEARWDVGDHGAVHYVVDEFADVRYMVALNADTRSADAMAEEIAASLPSWSLDELLEELDVNIYPVGRAKSLMRLGVGSPRETDKTFVMRVRETITEFEARVRRAAVWAMVYTEWPAYRDMLAQMSRDDDDPEIRNEATAAVALLDQRLSEQ